MTDPFTGVAAQDHRKTHVMTHNNSEIRVMKQQGNNFMAEGQHSTRNCIKGLQHEEGGTITTLEGRYDPGDIPPDEWHRPILTSFL